jgi:N utilization substance protein A
VCNAIAPAEVSRVIIDAEGHRMELIVPDDKLSQAIGKKGQNVRLASQLTGWKIDIHSESKIREIEAQAKIAMSELPGMNVDMAETLFKLGWRSVPDLAEAVIEELSSVPGLGGGEAARRIKTAAADWVAVERAQWEAHQREVNRRARMNDDQKLLEVRGIDKDTLLKLKAAAVTSVEQLARLEDGGKLLEHGIDAGRIGTIVHFARIWLGLIPADTPLPEGAQAVAGEGLN